MNKSLALAAAFLTLFSAFFAFAQETAEVPDGGSPEPPRSAESSLPETPEGEEGDEGAEFDESGLPRSFRRIVLGMDLDGLKDALSRDDYFYFRGDRDVSLLPTRNETLIDTTGFSFIRRAYFQLKDGAVFIMAFTLDPEMLDHYSVFTSFVRKYGEPGILDPKQAVWTSGQTRVSIERPLTVKYIDLGVFNELVNESEVRESSEVYRRQEFLDSF
ncbi:MAG: hypothetical protein LBI85_06275 [Spirochaetaceae bacterium]|jgi:hypothetical protein|nr:hypothetical protein [Spirochaetaceae bacterium]